MENPITRAEHEEFRRRLEEENKRQDARIGILEDSVQQIGALATSVEKLALSMQSMLKSRKSRANGWKCWRAATARSGARSWATLPRRLWALCLATCLSRLVCEEARECEE